MFIESNAFARTVGEPQWRGLYLDGDEVSNDARAEHPRQPFEVVGFYNAMDQLGDWEPAPILNTVAGAGGACEHGFFADTLAKVSAALADAGPLDGVYICNHGAMITTEEEDADGVFFAAVRDAVGSDVPIVATLDPHGNVSDLMVDSVDVVVAYRTDPHVDQVERGQEAAAVMHELWAGVEPHPVFVKLPIVAPNVSLFTDHGPFAELIQLGEERVHPDIFNVSILGGFAFSDTAKNGLAIIVTGRNTAEAATNLARDLADLGWANRERFIAEAISIDDAVHRAVAAGVDHTLPAMVMSDLGDNAGAGGPVNTLWMLEALHQAGAQDTLIVNFRDRHVVQAAQDAGIGSTFTATFTGDNWQRSDAQGSTYQTEAKVLALHDGNLVGRRGIVAGKSLRAGPMALVDLGGVRVVVTSYTAVGNDPIFSEALGVDLAEVQTIVVKVRSSFPPAYDEFVTPENMLFVDTPGRTSPMLDRMPLENLPRPVYPLDQGFEWTNPLGQPSA